MELENALRIGAFLAILVVMALWESVSPKRPWKGERRFRWTNHLLLSVINTMVARIVIPVALGAYALHMESVGFGALHLLDVPYWIKVAAGALLLDLVIYWQHVMFHKVPILWRLHRMHHTDVDFDVTTGIRFHPIEIALSMLIKFAFVAILGAPALAVLIFEVLLNGTSMFNHGNVRIRPALDRALRWFVVTPDMHRVHHSILRHETDSNFGFNFPWWDRIFGTYRQFPQEGYEDMTIGLPEFRDLAETRVDRLITQPFRDVEPGS